MKRYQVGSNLTEKEILHLVEMGERGFSDQLLRLSNQLLGQEDLHFLGLTGPTCSGKTTTAEMLTDAFENAGKQIHVISIDDFYYDKDYLQAMAEKKGLASLDYDSEDTIDMALLEECIGTLRGQKRTVLPRFNFATGQREVGEEISPSSKDIFLFEGIQVLYPRVDSILQGNGYRSIHIAPQSAVETGGEVFEPNEIRLMRRLVRDYRFRNSSPQFTLSLWQSVRENEERMIFPNVHRCNYSIDSTMPYDVGILKPFLEEILLRLSPDDGGYQTAQTILSELRGVQPLSSELIPEKSLYKEFI